MKEHERRQRKRKSIAETNPPKRPLKELEFTKDKISKIDFIIHKIELHLAFSFTYKMFLHAMITHTLVQVQAWSSKGCQLLLNQVSENQTYIA